MHTFIVSIFHISFTRSVMLLRSMHTSLSFSTKLSTNTVDTRVCGKWGRQNDNQTKQQ